MRYPTALFCLVCFCMFSTLSFSQSPPDTVIFTEQGSYIHPGFDFNYNAKFDRNNAPYIYAASTTLGLTVYDFSNPSSPFPANSYPPSFFGDFQPTGIQQVGNLLYVTCGNFQQFGGDSVGIAVMDVSTPPNLSLVGFWKDSTLMDGASMSIVEGDYAYIALFHDGIGVLDISDLQNIQLLSTYIPDPMWPSNLQTNPNARGINFRNDTLFLAYDAGGLRLIDVSNKSNPVEISRYIHTPLHNQAFAFYNNVELNENYAYMAVDYCGLDVADITTPNAPTNTLWFDPWACNDSSWHLNDGHTNELAMVPSEDLLIVGGGDTEIQAFDVSNPSTPRLVGEVANLMDSTVGWGIDVWNGKVCLALVDNTLSIILIDEPYVGTKGGIAIYDYQVLVGSEDAIEPRNLLIDIGPVPAAEFLDITIDLPQPAPLTFQILDIQGRQLMQKVQSNLTPGKSQIRLDLEDLSQGVYILSVESLGHREFRKFIR